MDLAEARAVLGVAASADAAAVRAAYRRLIRTAHPDVAGARGNAQAVRLNEAYAVLSRHRRAVATPSGPRPAARPPVPDVQREGASLRLPWPPAESFVRAVEAGHALGEVTFIDRGASLLEVIVDVEGEACSFVCSFHRTSDGTEVRCTLESIERVASLPPGPVVATFAQFVVDPS